MGHHRRGGISENLDHDHRERVHPRRRLRRVRYLIAHGLTGAHTWVEACLAAALAVLGLIHAGSAPEPDTQPSDLPPIVTMTDDYRSVLTSHFDSGGSLHDAPKDTSDA